MPPFLSFSYPFPFSHPFHLEISASMSSLPWELWHWPCPCRGCCIPPLGSLPRGCSWTLGRNFMELGNLHFPFSFVSLQARLELTLRVSLAGLRAVLGHQTAPNPFSGAQQHSVVSGGSLPLLCLLCPCVQDVWLAAMRLHCPVSSQPPGDGMPLRFGSCCSVPLSCHCLCPCQQAASPERGLLTHSQSPWH